MPQPEIVVNSIKASAEKCFFDTSVSSISFDGFYKVMPPGKNSGYVEYNLAELSEETSLDIVKADKSQHFTKPSFKIFRSKPCKGIGKERDWATIHLSRDYYQYPRKGLCKERIKKIVCN